jgi:hypothetical protein
MTRRRNYTLTFGNLTFDNEGKPIVEIVVGKTPEDSKVVGYLTSFRNYSFQVSASKDGECDMGSTEPIFRLPSVFRLMEDNNERVELLKGLITRALTKYTNTSYGHSDAEGEAISVLPGTENEWKLDAFAAIVLEYYGCGEAEDLIHWCSAIDYVREFKGVKKVS